VRDIGISYPVIISLIFTIAPILLMPYFLFNAPTMLMVLFVVLLIGGLVALLAPSAYKVDININKAPEEKENN
jgi:prepilin signal peptidase PulO-like enzyme (type II secretory pathway)